jgi:hypothetical protein
MKKHDEGEFELNLHPRKKEPVTLEVPTETLESLRKAAAARDMSVDALLKLYIGQGLRQDLSRLFADRVLEMAAHVLARHIQSEEEVSSIIREIRTETVGAKQSL